jgi:hypothetical protein
LMCPITPSSLGEVSIITLVTLTLITLNPLAFFVALVAVVFTALAFAHGQHTFCLQTQEPLLPLFRQRSRCCHSWLFTSSWLIVTSSHRHQHPPLIVAAAVIVAIALQLLPPIHTYRGIHSEERKGRNSLFLFMHNF